MQSTSKNDNRLHEQPGQPRVTRGAPGIAGGQAREQALATATLPFIYPHLDLMPDAHLGKSATVGFVIPTLHAIIPAAVAWTSAEA
ncbi:UNVERIFIED_ORG: RNA-splicing ligase RtcB [Arthrobacter sp. UYCu721]